MAKDVIARLKTDTSQWNTGLAQASQSINKFRSECLSANNVVGGMTRSVMSMASSFVGPAAAVGALTTAIKNNVETATVFEKSLSELSSLTGMSGAALDNLKNKAIELGGSTTQSASQVVDAFKLIGSQKPELLSNANALNDVTKAAITLAEASGNDVKSSATALTASLNIMGEGADQAQRYINVLAAASQAGSVDIQGLTEIIFKSGQAASMNKLSFEEFIALAETIGPKFGSAAEAGTALNQMLLKLETQTNDKYKPSVVGLEQALENLSQANMTASEKTKLVTETGFKALQAILENSKAVGDLRDKITGTNTASEQARINTDNLDGALKNLSSKWERLNLTINSNNSILTSFINLLGEGLSGATETVQAIKDIGSAFDSSNQYVQGAIQGIKDYFTELTKYISGGGIVGKGIRILCDLLGLGGGKEEVEGDFSDDIFDRERWLENLKKKKYGTSTPTTTTTTNPKQNGGISPITSSLDLDGAQDYTYKLYQQQTEDFQRRKAQQQFNVANPFVEQETSLGSITDLDWYIQMQEELNNNPLLISVKLNEDELPDLSGAFNQKDAMKSAAKSAQGAAQAFSALGQAMATIKDPAAQVAGTIAMAIANIAGGMAAMLAAPQSTAQSWGWIALAISATATMISTIAAIKSATSGYAEGGRITGPSFYGDSVPIMANAGEIVLNAGQQQNLAAQLENRESSNSAMTNSIITGEQIVTVINAYGKRTGRGEILK